MSNTKTIRQWLEELPESYRTQALAALEKQRGDDPGGTSQIDIGGAIASAFDWSNSEEGHDFWQNLSDIYIGVGFPPTNALSTLHAIALKKGFAVEDIMSVALADKENNQWSYSIKDVEEMFFINL
jgi:hypothetical protein